MFINLNLGLKGPRLGKLEGSIYRGGTQTLDLYKGFTNYRNVYEMSKKFNVGFSRWIGQL